MGRATPIFTPLKEIKFSYNTYENLLSWTSLPTSEPATSQIIYTVSEDDLPSLNMGFEQALIIAAIYAAGRNWDSVGRTVYWRMIKNGSSLANGSFTVSTTYYWTLNSFFHDVAIGDVLELRLWANSSNVYLRYEARQLQYSRLGLLSGRNLEYFRIYAEGQPSLTLGSPSVRLKGVIYVYHRIGIYASSSAGVDASRWESSATYRLYRLYYGDRSYQNSAFANTHSSSYPYYNQNVVPSRILLRAVEERIP